MALRPDHPLSIPMLATPSSPPVALRTPRPRGELTLASTPVPKGRPWRQRPLRGLRTFPWLRRHPWLSGALCLGLLWMLVWGWQLWLPLCLGLVAAGWIYQRPAPWLTGAVDAATAEQRWPWAVGTGGLVTLVLYSGLQIWQTVHSFWLAVLLGAQTLALSLLLTRHWASPSPSTSLETALADLAHPAPLQRLLAIRQLRHWATPVQRQTLTACLQLLLEQEAEPLVRQEAWRLLQDLDALSIPSTHPQ